MKRQTKIVATIGPASGSAEMIARLLDKGVNVFRLNFSHGSHDSHRQQASIIRKVLQEKNTVAALLGDLQGPKIRIGDIEGGSITISEGDKITLTIDKTVPQTSTCIPVHYQPLPDSVKPGDTLLLDDGLMRLTVEAVDNPNVHCRVVSGGELKSRKGINRLGGGLSAPAITEKDHEDIKLAAELELDYLAVSFPSSADDLLPVRKQLKELGKKIDIISKIERAEAVASDQVLIDLIKASDGVMVARGDLGVEIGDAQLIGVQKKIIRLARHYNRPVITATQMMESMINATVPTRAEVFDVANAVLDGTDAVMLSAETATGKYPAQVVEVMANTCIGAEQHPDIVKSRLRLDKKLDRIDEAITLSALYAANHMTNIAAIICLTESGSTPLFTSRLSTELPIYGISRHARTCNKMALIRNVIPIHCDITAEPGKDIYESAMRIVAMRGELSQGQRVAIMCGDFSGNQGGTNTLKVMEYGG